MSLLDSVIGALAGGQGGQAQASPGGLGGAGTQGALLSAVIAMLANGQQPGGAGVGGLGDLIGRFTRSGMGDVIGQLAQQLGLSHGEVAGQLSQILPQAIDRLTPHGEAPADGLGGMDDILAQLRPR